MIIGKEPNYFDAEAFIEGLQRTSRGVTRVSIQPITPDPGFLPDRVVDHRRPSW